MKILLIGKYFHPVLGGVENHILNLAEELVKRGHSISVYCSNKGFSDEEFSEHENLNGIEIRRFSDLGTLFGAITMVKDFDIIHYHLYRNLWIGMSTIAGKVNGAKLVLTPHCVYPPRNLSDKIAKSLYDNTLGKIMLSSVSKIISLTEQDKEDIAKLGANPEKIEIVPNSIRLEDYDLLADGDLFKAKYNIDNFFLYVGRVDWNKGLEYVIQAMPELRDLDLKFVIVGEDLGYRTKLEKLARNLGVDKDIVFTRRILKELLHSAYASCEFFILPSFYEGLPTVVLEAMAFGKPVIATKTGGTKYVIKHGSNGFLIDYGSPDDICEKVKILLSSFKSRIGENARRDVGTNYTWEKSAEKIEKIYQECLQTL